MKNDVRCMPGGMHSTRHGMSRPGTGRWPSVAVTLLVTTGVLLPLVAGCSGVAPAIAPPAATPPELTASAVSPGSPTAVPVAATAWVPPTALAGTPIPGAVATLTGAPKLRTAVLSIVTAAGSKTGMTVEVADTDASRELGLMFRTDLAPDSGMLFDFGSDTTTGFWMQNTLLPLSIAFIKADGTILDIKDMRPLDTTTVEASGPYRYALETNQGFFAAHNIAPGDHVNVPGAQSAVIPGMPRCR